MLQLKRIGDLVLTTSACAALREDRPDADVTLVTGPGTGSLLPALPVDRAVMLGGCGTLGRIVAGGYDVCVDFTGSDRSALLAMASRAGLRIGCERFRKHRLRKLAWNVLVRSSVRERHTVDHLCDHLAPLGCPGSHRSPMLLLPESVIERGAALLAGAGVRDSYAVLHAGTARPEKYWSAERWASVAGGLGMPVVLTGSADPAELEHVAAIARRVPTATNVAGRTTLLELAALVRGARVFLGCDSAAMHLAAAFERPCVVLFGPTNPFHWAPRHPAARVLRAGVRPPFTPAQQGGPMDGITAEEVLAEVRALCEQICRNPEESGVLNPA
jgi:ADP-heptose:LPS heptosyltransferase